MNSKDALRMLRSTDSRLRRWAAAPGPGRRFVDQNPAVWRPLGVVHPQDRMAAFWPRKPRGGVPGLAAVMPEYMNFCFFSAGFSICRWDSGR